MASSSSRSSIGRCPVMTIALPAAGIASLGYGAYLLFKRLSRKVDGRRSKLYRGKVWHTRFHPTRHSFSYTIFYAYLDLDELPTVFDGLWPLASTKHPALARFNNADHLKGVGDPSLPLVDRVRQLVQDKTGTRPEGPICLLTHLSYLGYCFNPVSFYYVWDKTGEKLETVVAEVSNTPWLEMHCYVLDPRNAEIDVKRHGEDGWNYRFQKVFHVSPFMDMEHMYDWFFTPPRDSLTVSNSMFKGPEQWFNALMTLHKGEMTGLGLAECCLRWPLLTWTVQYLIHLQAFYLWWKQVPFYSHPEGTETFASKAVGTVMAPLFKLQEMLEERRRSKQQEGGSSSSPHYPPASPGSMV